MLKPVSLLASASTLSPSVTAEFSGDKAAGIGSDELEFGSHQQRRELSFPVTIQLDDQQLRLKSGSSLPLQVGISLTVHFNLHTVSFSSCS